MIQINRKEQLENLDRDILPEVELGHTCHIIVLPVDFQHVSRRVKIVQELREFALAEYKRKSANGFDWRWVFVVPTENVPVNSPVWQEIRNSYGEIQYHEKVC